MNVLLYGVESFWFFPSSPFFLMIRIRTNQYFSSPPSWSPRWRLSCSPFSYELWHCPCSYHSTRTYLQQVRYLYLGLGPHCTSLMILFLLDLCSVFHFTSSVLHSLSSSSKLWFLRGWLPRIGHSWMSWGRYLGSPRSTWWSFLALSFCSRVSGPRTSPLRTRRAHWVSVARWGLQERWRTRPRCWSISSTTQVSLPGFRFLYRRILYWRIL